MKIICDCGAESIFEIDLNDELSEDEYYKEKNVDTFNEINGDIFIKSNHDGLFFTCEKCGKKIFCFGAQYGRRRKK